MIYIINNNTTHSYSAYSTRPNHIYTALLRTKLPIGNRTGLDATSFETSNKYLFQTKQLLCWGPDLAFFNLRSTFSNILKALQVCRSAVRNNKKILFVNGNDSIDAGSILMNGWLTQQYKRDAMPRKLSNIAKTLAKYSNYSSVSSKYSRKSRFYNILFNNLNSFLNNCSSAKMPLVASAVISQAVIKNPNSLLNSVATKSSGYYINNPILLSGWKKKKKSQDGYSQDAGPKTKQHILNPTPVLKSRISNKITKSQLKYSTAVSFQELHKNQNQLVANNNNNNQFKIKTKNAIRLQVKEAQTLTQQVATEIAAPLVGFLTNTKTGFTISRNQLNQDFYDHSQSVYFKGTPNKISKSPVHVYTKTPDQPSGLRLSAAKNNCKSAGIQIQSYWATEVYSQYYLPFSFYIRPVFSDYTNSLSTSPSYKTKQHIVKQNLFGSVFAWRLKGQHPSSLFYSKFKAFDQRNKHKSKGRQSKSSSVVVNQPTLVSTKPLQLFKHTVDFFKFKKQIVGNSIGLKFYSKFKPNSVYNGVKNKQKVLGSVGSLRHDKYNTTALFKKSKNNNNSIHNYYIKRFYQSINTNTTYKNKQKKKYTKSNMLSTSSASFRSKKIRKLYKGQLGYKQILSKNYKYRGKKFRNYYNKFLTSNQFKQYQMFAKSPCVNNKLADIIFFINPEKNQSLVNQANSLKIPTIGVISGTVNSGLGRRSCNYYSLNNLVNYPILGNPSSSFFIYTVIGVFIKTLRSN